ncbi:MAG: tyrosine--tRNA ligase [Acetanaerobacterium sp.]
MSVFDVLKERGLIAQMTHENEIRELLENEKVTFYIGFDATADSLHVGHFLQMMVMSHMQRAGHRPIALLGTGTTMVGDPTGKSDMRKMLTPEEIEHNAECFRRQMSKFIDFSDDKAIIAKNGDWLMNLNYIEFLREIGVHFSVNRMLTADCFKTRLEKGLTFIEFNYMLMQSYDFLKLSRDFDCKLQLGGDDQWSNIIGGVELARRCDARDVYGMTFTLLTTKEGKKMGKTEKGAIWLDPEKTPPYEFFQYWRNVEDSDVINCLKLITFVPIEEIREMEHWEGSELNKAKERLAYELTTLVHGKDEAEKARSAARALFSAGGSDENMPTTQLAAGGLADGKMDILELLTLTGLVPSKGEARRLIQQGGISINGEKVANIAATISQTDFTDGQMMIKKGKKVFHKVVL